MKAEESQDRKQKKVSDFAPRLAICCEKWVNRNCRETGETCRLYTNPIECPGFTRRASGCNGGPSSPPCPLRLECEYFGEIEANLEKLRNKKPVIITQMQEPIFIDTGMSAEIKPRDLPWGLMRERIDHGPITPGGSQ